MATPKKRAAAKPKAPKIEPFFRPFSKITTAVADAAPPAGKPGAHAAAKRAAPAAKPAAPVDGPRGGGGTVEDDTFAIYMSGVRALGAEGATRIPRSADRLERAAPAAPADAPDPDEGARARMRALVEGAVRFEVVDDGERLEGRRLDVDPRDLRRLRRGQYALDAKLDLHGLAVADARVAVDAFLKLRAAAGDQAVVVVHGKGSHSPRGVGALRGEISAWLSQGSAARHVRAFATATPDAGGSGALWVLLAR